MYASFFNIARFPYFCAKFQKMAAASKNKGLMWILFFLSTAFFLFLIFSHNPWLTLVLPFVTTFFVKAMDII